MVQVTAYRIKGYEELSITLFYSNTYGKFLFSIQEKFSESGTEMTIIIQ